MVGNTGQIEIGVTWGYVTFQNFNIWQIIDYIKAFEMSFKEV